MPPPQSDYTDYSFFNKPISGTSKKTANSDILKLILPNFKSSNAVNNHTLVFQHAIEKNIGTDLHYNALIFLQIPSPRRHQRPSTIPSLYRVLALIGFTTMTARYPIYLMLSCSLKMAAAPKTYYL